MFLYYRYRDTNTAVVDLENNSDDKVQYSMYKWYSLLNTKVTNTDTQYISRVLIIIYSMLSIDLNSDIIYLYSYILNSTYTCNS